MELLFEVKAYLLDLDEEYKGTEDLADTTYEVERAKYICYICKSHLTMAWQFSLQLRLRVFSLHNVTEKINFLSTAITT